MKSAVSKELLSQNKYKRSGGTLVDVLQLSYSFHQNCSKLGTAITEDFKN
jgi:hypothetical protein